MIRKTCIVACVMVSSIMIGACPYVRVLIVTTPSIPYKLCLHLRKIQPKKGDCCVFQLKHRTLIKYLVGTSGDPISVNDNKIFVDGRYIGDIKHIPNLTPIEHKQVPKGYVFVAGSHEQSLDSRYKEFGLIPESSLEGKAIGFIKR